MSKVQCVFFNENQLIEYLRKYGPRFHRKRLPTDNEEVVFAIWMKRILEAKTGKRFLIAFELKGELQKLMPSFNPGVTTDIKELFDRHIERGTVIDFALALKKQTGMGDENTTGFAFQLKIFDVTYDNPEVDLTKKINHCLLQKYPKLSQDISLLVIPQIKGTLYLEKILDVDCIKKNIKPRKGSFEKIFILSGNAPDMYLAEIYPNPNIFQYPPKI